MCVYVAGLGKVPRGKVERNGFISGEMIEQGTGIREILSRRRFLERSEGTVLTERCRKRVVRREKGEEECGLGRVSGVFEPCVSNSR